MTAPIEPADEAAAIDRQVREILTGVFAPAGIRLWMASPNPRTWAMSPTDAIASGDGERVLAEARRIAGVS